MREGHTAVSLRGSLVAPIACSTSSASAFPSLRADVDLGTICNQTNTSQSINHAFYQVSFSYAETGKRIASTKRVMSWRFGEADSTALRTGATGIACCGDEHTITATWSLSSGKVTVTVNGEIIFDNNETAENSSQSSSRIISKTLVTRKSIDLSWQELNNKISLRLIMHAKIPEKAQMHCDLLIDECSFFKLPKLKQMGVSGQYKAKLLGHVDPLYGQYSSPSMHLSSQQRQRLLQPVASTFHDSQLSQTYIREEEKVDVEQEIKCRRQQEPLEEYSYDGVEPLY